MSLAFSTECCHTLQSQYCKMCIAYACVELLNALFTCGDRQGRSTLVDKTIFSA